MIRRFGNFVVPLLNFAVTAALQVLIPSILQTRLSVAAYAAFVLVSSAAGYIGIADGGLWLPILRELTTLHGSNSLPQYVGELHRSNRIYLFASSAGLLAGLAAFFAARPTIGASWHPALDAPFMWAATATLAAVAFRFWSSSFYVAILSSTSRYIFGQVVFILNQLVPAIALCVALFIWRDLTASLWLYAGCISLQGAIEAVAAWQLFRREFSMVVAESPPRRLVGMVSDGLSIRVGEQLVLFGLPYALTIVGIAFVPVAIPARTLANSCRLICQQFVSLLGVRITRLVAQSDAGQASAVREYHLTAAMLSGLYLFLVATVDLAARPIFYLWLPHVASDVRAYLPGLMADQVLLTAVLPASIMFLAHGQFRSWGIAKLCGALLAVAVLIGTVAVSPRAAFGLAHFASTLPSFLLCAWAELGGRLGFPSVATATKLRYIRAVLLSGAYLSSPNYVWLIPCLAIVTSAPGIVGTARALHLLHRRSTH